MCFNKSHNFFKKFVVRLSEKKFPECKFGFPVNTYEIQNQIIIKFRIISFKHL